MPQTITLQDAITMTTLYRQQSENILAPNFRNQNILPQCESFERSVFDNLLARPGCQGVRVYYSMSPDLKLHVIIVGVDSNGADMVSKNDILIENSTRCPPQCPPTSPLNS